jgi:two-component system NtrC family sensor kinase
MKAFRQRRIVLRLQETNHREQVARQERESRLQQQLASVGRLAAGIAHEINSPIQFLGDSIHFLQDSFQALTQMQEAYRALLSAEQQESLASLEEEADIVYMQEETPKALQRALEGVRRVASLVSAMKEFSRPDSEEMAAADVNKALRNAVEITKNEHKYLAEIRYSLGDIPPIYCHIGALSQVFINLIVNAAHAIGDVVGKSGNRGIIELSTSIQRDRLLVAIRDTGNGIPTHVQARMFESFFTTKERGKGTGQGLGISRTIVLEHGGTLSFETEQAKGTTFSINLPLDCRPIHQTS